MYVMQLPHGTPRRLTSDTVHEQNPSWSPDGRTIAYITWGNAGGYIQVVGADGRGKPDRLTPEPAFYMYPAWSPDGQRIVALRGPREARLTEGFGPGYELGWLPAKGGAPQRVAPINPEAGRISPATRTASTSTIPRKAWSRCGLTGPTAGPASR